MINRFRAPALAGARHTDTRASMSKRKAAADGPSFVSLPGERLPARTLLYCALP